MEAKKLLTLLEGELLVVLLELLEELHASYKAAKAKIIKTIVPVYFVYLDDFCAHKLQTNEALPVLFFMN